LSESIRELEPILKVPPPFELESELRAVAAYAASATTAMPATSAA
jgi:hypothetical protein